jgi:hypothetical protein
VILEGWHARQHRPEATGIGVANKGSAYVSKRATIFGIDAKTDDMTAVGIVRAILSFCAMGANDIIKRPVRRRRFGVELQSSLRQDHLFIVRDISLVADREMARFGAFIEHGKAEAFARFARRTGDAAQGAPQFHAGKTEAHACVPRAALGRHCGRIGRRTLRGLHEKSESSRGKQTRSKPDHGGEQ